MRSTMLVLILLMFACETKEHADAELAALKKAQDAAASAGAHARTPEEEIGIPECDAYIRRMEACLTDKVPVEARPQVRTALDAQTKQWREAAKDKFARDAVADQCRMAAASAKQSMSGYGCEF